MSSMETMPSSHGSFRLSAPLLRVFTVVAQLGSFTAAGPALGYTQSAISRQISTLEAESGVALFDRLPRGVRLTEAGRRLLAHAQAVLDRLEVAHRELVDLRELATGRLRVGAFATADATLVPEAIAAFHTAYPDVTVSLREGFTPELLGMLTEGEVDVAVVSYSAAYHVDGVDLHKLCDDHMYVALPRDHRRAGARRLRLTELAEESWIAGSSRPEETLISSCLRTGFEPRIGFVAKDWVAKQGFVAAGLGITLIPSLIAGAARPDIVLVPLHPEDVPPRQVYAATTSGLTPSPATSAFLTLLGGGG